MQNNNDCSNKISGDDLTGLYESFIHEYSVISIEEPFHKEDQEHYAKMTDRMKVQIVQREMSSSAVQEEKSHAVILKLRGSVTKCINYFRSAQKSGCVVMASHEGTFFDDFIDHLCVGLSLVSRNFFSLCFSHDIESLILSLCCFVIS